MKDCGGFAPVGLLLFYVIGVNLGLDVWFGLFACVVAWLLLFSSEDHFTR